MTEGGVGEGGVGGSGKQGRTGCGDDERRFLSPIYGLVSSQHNSEGNVAVQTRSVDSRKSDI